MEYDHGNKADDERDDYDEIEIEEEEDDVITNSERIDSLRYCYGSLLEALIERRDYRKKI